MAGRQNGHSPGQVSSISGHSCENPCAARQGFGTRKPHSLQPSGSSDRRVGLASRRDSQLLEPCPCVLAKLRSEQLHCTTQGGYCPWMSTQLIRAPDLQLAFPLARVTYPIWHLCPCQIREYSDVVRDKFLRSYATHWLGTARPATFHSVWQSRPASVLVGRHAMKRAPLCAPVVRVRARPKKAMNPRSLPWVASRSFLA